MASSKISNGMSGPRGAQRAKRVADWKGGQRDPARKPGVTQALEEERACLALVAINHGHYDWEILDNTIYYSPLLRGAFGMRDDQILTPEESTSRIHPDDLPAYRAALVAHLKGETPRFVSEYRYRDNLDQWRW